MGILYATLAVLVLIIAIVLIRTVMLKPTAARTAIAPRSDAETAERYGQKLSVLIQKETISSRYEEDRTKFYEFHEILEKEFPLIHKTCEKHVFNGSLLFKWAGRKSDSPILFMSHHDVVEATGVWEEKPFSGAIKNGAVWGRGTVDTKGSLFCFLTAAEEMISEGYVPEQDVYLASSCTEEFSGEGAPLTVQYLKEQGIRLSLVIDEGGMILDEPMGGVEGTYAMIGVLEKGYGDLKFIARGKGGHASAPPRNTPLARLAAFIQDVEKHNPFRLQFNATTLEMFRRMAPNMNFGMRLIFSNMWLFKPLLKKLMPSISAAGAAMIRTSIAFTTAKGSDGLNVLPQEAYVTANLRFIPHQPTDESIQLISEVAQKYDIETEVIYKNYPCPVVDYNSTAFHKVENAVAKIFPGVGVIPYVMTGGTDARFYQEVCDNCIRFAPLYINKQQYASIHGLNENIDCDVLAPAVEFYKEIIRNA